MIKAWVNIHKFTHTSVIQIQQKIKTCTNPSLSYRHEEGFKKNFTYIYNS